MANHSTQLIKNGRIFLLWCIAPFSSDYKKRLTYELDVIEKMNYVDYFLIVYDFILFSKI